MRREDREQLERVAALVREVLGRDVLGAYVFGSAVLGGLRAESDLDVLAVSGRAATPAEKQAFAERLLAISGRRTRSGRLRRVELTIVVESEVVPWRYPPGFDFQYGDWLRSAFERDDPDVWAARASPDLALLVAQVLLAGAPLFGPPPAALLDPVPHEDLVRALVECLDPLLGDLADDTRNVVLTLARIWSTLATGDVRSKDAAAEWALPRLPAEHREVLEHARAAYAGEGEERWDELRERVVPYADAVVAGIDRLVAPAPERG